MENKGKNTLLKISLSKYLCICCKGTTLSLGKRGEIPISLRYNDFLSANLESGYYKRKMQVGYSV